MYVAAPGGTHRAEIEVFAPDVALVGQSPDESSALSSAAVRFPEQLLQELLVVG